MQNANWTFTGSAGTTIPATPFQGTSIQFKAPDHVPVQQVNTLQGCKVDTSHGLDCSTAQIIVEPLIVSIPPGDSSETPPAHNPTELLGGEQFTYKAVVTQGAVDLADSQVTWTNSDTSGLNLIKDFNSSTGFVQIAPQSQFENGAFFVDIQATSAIDNAQSSAPFSIHIPTATVTYVSTPTPGLHDIPPTPPATNPTFEATPGRVLNFAANVDGPQNPQNRVINGWEQNFIPTSTDFSEPGSIHVGTNPNEMGYKIGSPPPKGDTVVTTIKACVGGHLDALSGILGLIDAKCAEYPLSLFSPVFPTSPPPAINSGESEPITITGTGFGAAPTITFTNSTLSFSPTSISGPDANAVTTVTGTLTALPVPADTQIPLTINSSLSPPRTPVNQNVTLRPVTLTPSITPFLANLQVTQSQQFAPHLGCQTVGGQTCNVPQQFTCSVTPSIGVINASTCLYTAPASLAAVTGVTVQACFTFGGKCASTTQIVLVPPNVAVSPTSISLDSAQSQQFQATVGGVPSGSNQGVTWSINPAVGSVNATGLYTVPAVVTAPQNVSVTACSVLDPLVCASADVTLNPVTVALAPSAVTLGQGQTQQFQATVTHSPSSSVVWSISPLVGSISSTGLYTAPPTVTGNQTVIVKACSSIAPSNCASSTVNLIPPDFALSVSPSTGNTGMALIQPFTISIGSIGAFAGTVTLSATVPSGIGMTSEFSPATVTGSGTSVVQFFVSPSTPGGNYPITITGTSGGLQHSAQVTVTVLVESMTITVSPPQTAAAGATVTFTFTVTNNNFFAQDGISYTGIPPGSTITPTAWGGSGPGSLTFTTPTTLSPGTYPITITATGGSLTASATTSLTIPDPLPPPPDPGSGGCGQTKICLIQ